MADTRAKALVDATAFEWLQEEWDQSAQSVDELHGELEVADQEREATVCRSEEVEERERAAKGSLAGKILLLFPSIRWIPERDMLHSSPLQPPNSRWLPSSKSLLLRHTRSFKPRRLRPTSLRWLLLDGRRLLV